MSLESEFIGQRIKLQHLKIIMAVADWGSMQKAARHLGISQPVVSKVIAEIEHLLGVSLFDRSSQGVEATPYGRAVIKRGAAIFDDLRTCVDEIKFLAIRHLGSCELVAPNRCLPVSVLPRWSGSGSVIRVSISEW